MTLRQRPKSDYLHQASWESLFVLTEHWSSEMKFYKDEIHFLKDLLNKYFIWLIKDDHLKEIQDLVKRMQEADNELNKTSEEIRMQMSHINDLMENSFSHDETEFRSKHENLENSITEFLKSFRGLKKDVFKVVKSLLVEEKLKHLLNS